MYANFSLLNNPFPDKNSELYEFCNKHLALAAYDYDIYDDNIKCGLFKIKRPLFTPGWNGVILKKHSPLKEVFNYV